MNWPPSTCSIGFATAVTSSSSSSRAETPPASVGAHDPGDPLTVDPLLVGDAVVELGGDRGPGLSRSADIPVGPARLHELDDDVPERFPGARDAVTRVVQVPVDFALLHHLHDLRERVGTGV